MNAMLLLALLAQVPGPMPPMQDSSPADPVVPLPFGMRQEDDETRSLCYRTFGPDTVVRLGTDPRLYRRLSMAGDNQVSAGVGRYGVGLLYELYLRDGVSFYVEARTVLFCGTARVGLIWYPIEGTRLPFSIDLAQWRILLPEREGVLEAAMYLGACYWSFGRL
jgi:hypothetical protein